jgi:hypothetical protein
VNLGPPLVGGLPAKAVSHAMDRFAPGQFLDLTTDEKLSRPAFEERPAGARLAGTDSESHGKASESEYRWETVYPHLDIPRRTNELFQFADHVKLGLLKASAVGRAASTNPYLVQAKPARLADPAHVEIRSRIDLGHVAGGPATAATITEAAELLSELVASKPDLAGTVQLVGLGVGG